VEQYKTIRWQVNDGIGELILDNPPGNCLVKPDFLPLDTLCRWTADPGLRGIIVHGMGRHFSAGADLDNLHKLILHERSLDKRLASGINVLDHISGLNIPVIAAINGICFGGGLELALACHIRVSADNALYAFPEVNHNLMPGLGGTVRLPFTTGLPAAMQIILGGDTLTAAEAGALNLVDYVIPKVETLAFSFRLIRRMTAGRRPKVIRFIMSALRNAFTLPPDEAILRETAMFCELAQDEAARREDESTKLES
jgi:enoyl-CoA hydratase/carnithine racemase